MEKIASEVNMENISDKFSKSTSRAQELIKDKEKAKGVLQNAMRKADEIKGPLEKVIKELKLMFGLVSDWISGKYKDAPVGSIVAILAALGYLILPLDAIPDVLPVVGYIDDVFVIGLVFAQVRADLEKYSTWKESQC